jgi:hypothetical protein
VASLQQLQDDVLSYLDRRDSAARVASWVSMVETELGETLRARCMVTYATQPVDNAYIQLPADFATMESIRDNTTGELLVLKDQWVGLWTQATTCTAYRLGADCIEFLPHPSVPNPPDPEWQPQVVRMGWYAKPRPLILPSDTNPILEQLYAVYLYGVLAHAGVFEQDTEMAGVWDAKYQQVVTRANNWKQMSDYSGAPLAQEMSGAFG